MAIDPRIALGVQPVQQQPNMLAQYAQIMGIKAAQQEMEGNEGVRSTLSQGVPDDPATLLQYGKQGRATYESLLKGRREQLESNQKRIDMMGGLAGFVRERPTIENFQSTLDQAVSYGLMTPTQRQDTLAKYGGSPESIKAYADQTFQSALTAKDRTANETRLESSRISAGPQYARLAFDKTKDARDQAQLERIRGIVSGGVTPPATAPVAPMGGDARSSIFNPASTNVLADQVAPLTATQAPINALLNPPAGQSGAAPVANRVDEIMQQLTLLSKEVNPEANQAMERLVKELNVINPDGNIQIGKDGVIRTINKRSGVARVVTGADGQPVMGQVTPVTKDIVDPTDPSGKRMITVEVNSYKAGTGLGDGTQPVPAGVLGVASSQIPANYMRDPNNPQGVVPVPGSAADPNAAVPSGYRKTAGGQGLEFIPGGPEDPAVQAKQTTIKLSERDLANREAKYPQATAALKGFEAKTTKFVRDIDELITNEKGLNEITGFLAGRTDLSALSSEGRRALALFNTITAKGGFSELQDMRNSSPTGGALGNVSDREGRQLIDAVGALSRTQNAKDLRTSLGILKTDVLGANERLNDAYNLTYEYKNKDRVPTLPPGFVAD